MTETVFYRLLPGCPLQLMRARAEGEQTVFIFRNVSWCDLTSAELAAGDTRQTLTDIPSRAEVRAAFPSGAEPVVRNVVFSDGVAWRNETLSAGEDLPAPAAAGPSMPEFERYAEAWKGTDPLYRTEYTDRFWRCGCGQINEAGLTFCGGCDRPKEWVTAHADGETCLKTEQAEQASRETARKQAAARAEKRREKRGRILAYAGLGGGIIVFFAVILTLTLFFFRPARHYYFATRAESIDNFFGALEEYRAAGGYRDAPEKVVEMRRLLTCKTRVAAGYLHTVIVDTAGKVQGTGYAKDGVLLTSKWNAIRAVACGETHTVGLHFSGTVMAVGKNKFGECNLTAWKDIVAIGAGNGFTVGLRSDGTVVAAGNNASGQCAVSGWKNVKAIAVGRDFVLGQTESGEMLFAGKDHDGLAEGVGQWQNVVQFAAGNTHAVGVTADGAVVGAGDRTMSALEVGQWSDVIAVSAGRHFTVGVREDGTLVACGTNQRGQTSLDDVRDAAAVITGQNYTITLQYDGSLMFFGEQSYEEGLIGNWSLK